MTDHDRDKCEICQSLASQAAGNAPETAQGLNMACFSAATHVGHGQTEKTRHIANVGAEGCIKKRQFYNPVTGFCDEISAEDEFGALTGCDCRQCLNPDEKGIHTCVLGEEGLKTEMRWPPVGPAPEHWPFGGCLCAACDSWRSIESKKFQEKDPGRGDSSNLPGFGVKTDAGQAKPEQTQGGPIADTVGCTKIGQSEGSTSDVLGPCVNCGPGVPAFDFGLCTKCQVVVCDRCFMTWHTHPPKSPAEHMLLTDEEQEEAKQTPDQLDLDYAIFEVRAVLTRLERMRERR